jgi:UDP-N-acetylglucosamine 2-epimerase (non-hydrolysing)/GDP/UDP-N,N'-diacetylbacillosamine 2-epimerase (hydrolysing)
VTTEFEMSVEQLEPSLLAIKSLAAEGVQIIITYPNNDAGGRGIIARLNALKGESIPNIFIHQSLGRYLYHGVLALARDAHNKIACVGNSSSGIKESPAFGCPTVNIGSRQEGRLRSENVIDVGYNSQEIFDAVMRCFNDEGFRYKCRTADNPYYLGDAGKKIASVLASVPLNQKLLRKAMTLKGESLNGWFR